MSRSEINVTCFFADEGEAANRIIGRSFGFFLQRELARDSRKPVFTTPSHV